MCGQRVGEYPSTITSGQSPTRANKRAQNYAFSTRKAENRYFSLKMPFFRHFLRRTRAFRTRVVALVSFYMTVIKNSRGPKLEYYGRDRKNLGISSEWPYVEI